MRQGVEKTSSNYDSDLYEFNEAYDVIRKAISHTNDKSLIDAVNWSTKVLFLNLNHCDIILFLV